jgi:hypothetical protein
MPRRMGRPGLAGTMARTAVVAGTATAVSGSVAQRQHAKAQATTEQHAPPSGPTASAPAPPQPAAPPPPETTLAELERLVELKQQGLITDDEFAALKTQLIER